MPALALLRKDAHQRGRVERQYSKWRTKIEALTPGFPATPKEIAPTIIQERHPQGQSFANKPLVTLGFSK